MEDTRKTMTIKDRLAILEDVVSKPSFRSSRGKANEVNYWVFDYDPEDELALRRGIHDIEGKSRNRYPLQVFDLYDIMIDYLTERKFLEKVYKGI